MTSKEGISNFPEELLQGTPEDRVMYTRYLAALRRVHLKMVTGYDDCEKEAVAFAIFSLKKIISNLQVGAVDQPV